MSAVLSRPAVSSDISGAAEVPLRYVIIGD